MKPFISYYGGKQKMVKHLLPLIPPHKIYVEPFAGGASLFFAKDRSIVTNQDDYREVLNDTNSELVNLYEVAKAYPEEFLKRLDQIPYSEEKHRYYKKIKKFDDKIEWAVSFYIRIMMSFAKTLDKGFAFEKSGTNSCINYYNKVNLLPKILERIKNAYLFNRDALNIIDLFDCPEAFFYCDPPYPETDQGHYSGYSQADFDNLVEKLKRCQGSFMLSCYPNSSPPDDWERYEFNTVNTSSNTAKGGHREARKEVVWRKLNDWAKSRMETQLEFLK